MLNIPNHLLRNAGGVRSLGSSVETGLAILLYMCARIGVDDLSATRVLDIGCGVRFTQTLLHYEYPIAQYTGIELDEETVKLLNDSAPDKRFNFICANQKNAYYNADGKDDFSAMTSHMNGDYDLCCMFSVITHQNPDEAVKTFRLARAAVAPGGTLFFSALVHGDGRAEFETGIATTGVLGEVCVQDQKELAKRASDGAGYLEWNKAVPGRMSGYSVAQLKTLLAQTGWDVITIEPPFPNGVPVQTSFLCK